MTMQESGTQPRSSIEFTASSKHVVQATTKVYAGDDDPATLDHLLSEAQRVFEAAHEWAKQIGAQP